MPIDILQNQPLLASCEASLASRYTVHKLHEASDPQAFLDAVGDRIRAVATAGSASRELIEKLPRLEIIASFAVGYDGIDTATARARHIRVTNTPDVLNHAVAELAIGLMIGLARRIPQADRFVRQGLWQADMFPFQVELNGKTVGIVGLGRIGKEIAARAQAMRMRVVYHGRHQQPDEPYVYYPSLVEMARAADWLVVIAPGGKATQGIVSREVLEALGPAGYFVNMARGSLVDEPALIELLQRRRLGGAALDVFADEPNVPAALLALDNVVLSPHQASATQQTRGKMGDLLVANLDAHFAGEPLPSAVV